MAKNNKNNLSKTERYRSIWFFFFMPIATSIVFVMVLKFAEGGLLHAQGTHPGESLGRTVGWAALGPFGTLSARLIPVLELRADVGAVVPLTRYGFAFIDEPPVTETPPVALTAALGLAVAIP